MTTDIKLKKSSVPGRIPSVSDLEYGELAINYADGKVYYKNSSNEIKAFLDSAGVQALISNLSVDSAAVTSLIDSDYVQLHVVGLDYNALVNTPNVLDSNDVAIIAGQLEGLTEASARNIFDSDYIQLHSVGLDYNSLSNVPASAGLDSDQVVALIPDATYRGIRKYNYVATAGQDTFADSDALGNVLRFSHNSNIVVYLNGILLADSDDFSATNNTITLTAPAVADDVLTVHNIQAGGLDSASVIELNSRLGRVGINETVFTADSGQDTFTVSYVPGALLVTLNGIILLNGEDYTATNGSTVVLSDGADSGDTLIVATFGGDSARIETVVDSDYVQLRSIGLDYNLLSNTPSAADSVSEATNALTLNNQAASYYLDYTNFTNTPNILDSTNVQSIVTSYGYSTFDSTSFGIEFASKSTSDLSEGTNLYYTTIRHDSDFDARLSAGTGVTVSAGQVSIGQNVGTGDSVTFASVATIGNLVVGGDLQVDGTQTIINTQNLSVQDNMFYLNQLESAGSPTLVVDVGWVANVNDDGTYLHVGMFRDATDNTFKVFDQYTPEPDSASQIDTTHPSFNLAPFAAGTLTGQYLGFDSDFGLKTISDLPNDANYLDSTTVLGVIDASYIQSNQITYNIIDSVNVQAIIASYGYSTFDSVDAAGVIEAYGYSTFDSAEAIQIVNEDYIEARRPAEAIFNVINSGSSAYSFTGDGFPDSADNPTLHLQRGLTYKFNINAVDHPFEIRLSDGGSAYSSGVTNNAQNNGELIFTVPMNAPETLVYQCTVHSSMIGNIVLLRDTSLLDSAEVLSLIAAQGYLTDALDSSEVLNLIDSDYIQARQIIGGGTGGTDSATVISLITSTVDSDYIQARQIIGGTGGTGTIDSAAVLAIVATANRAGVNTFEFIADSGDTSVSGVDINGSTLAYKANGVVVYINGVLLREQDYTATDGSSISFDTALDSGSEVTVLSIIAGTTLGGTLSNYTYQADSAETVFSGPDIFGNTLEYATDKIQVYLNGILLIDSVDFAANDGSSIVLTTATDSADYVSIVAGLEGPASTWREVAESSYTAVANSKLIVDTSTGIVTVTLPGSPEFGDEVKIIDGTGNADSNNITINRNGNKILGADSDFILDVNRVAVDLVYYNTAQGWIISGNS